jgi:NTE family protein
MKSQDFQGRNNAILAGEQAAAQVMNQLKAKLAAKRQPQS